MIHHFKYSIIEESILDMKIIKYVVDEEVIGFVAFDCFEALVDLSHFFLCQS